MIDWNAVTGTWTIVSAVGQWAGAIGTVAAVIVALCLARKAAKDQKKTDLAVLQQSRLMAASLRAVAFATAKGDIPETHNAIRSVEAIVEEMEKAHNGDTSKGGTSSSPTTPSCSS